MARNISPQKQFLMDQLRAAIRREVDGGGLRGAELRDGDRNTFVVSFPNTVGPATEYTVTVREVQS